MADSETRTKRRRIVPWIRGSILLALLAAVVAVAVIRGVDTGKLIVGLAIAVGLVLALQWSRPTAGAGWRFSVKGLLASMAVAASMAAVASGYGSGPALWIPGALGLIMAGLLVWRNPRTGLRVCAAAGILAGAGLAQLASERAKLARLERLGREVATMGATMEYTYAGLPGYWQWLLHDRYTPVAAAANFQTPTSLSESQVRQLGQCVALHTLISPRAGIDDAGLASLRELRRMKWLDLSGNSIGNAGAHDLAGMADLEFLNLADMNIGDEGLNYLAGLSKLKDLNLSHTAITDRGLATLARCRSLRTLTLDHTALTEKQLGQLLSLPAITGLSLRGCRITNAVNCSLAKAPFLQTLDLGETEISDSGLARLFKVPGLPGIRQLRLDRTRITNASCPRLATLTALYWLDLGGTRVSDAGLPFLKSLPGLEVLSLRGTLVTDSGLKDLPPGRGGFYSIDLSDTKITGKGLKDFKGRPHSLILDGTRFEDRYLVDLLPLQLWYWSLERTSISDEGLKLLAKALVDTNATTGSWSPGILNVRKARTTQIGERALRDVHPTIQIVR